MNERKKRRQSFFKRITREMAIKEIKDLESKLGRPVTKKERHDIIHKVATGAKMRAMALALAFSMGFSGGLLVADNDEKKEEPPLDDKEKLALSADEDEILKETTRNSFVDQLRFEGNQNPMQEEPQEELVNPEVTKQNEAIDQIENENDLLNWFKALYANAYENQTGKKIEPSDLKFVKSENTYLYKDGDNYITHGSHPQITENAIGQNVETVSQGQDFDIYTIYIKDGASYKTLDVMTYRIVNGEKLATTVTSGDTFLEESSYNSNSILSGMGGIPKEVIEMIDLYGQLGTKNGQYIRAKINESKGELKKLISENLNGKTEGILIQADDGWEYT